MATIKIYDRTGLVRALVEADAGSEQVCELMGVDVVNLGFKLAIPMNFEIGDFAYVFDKKYTLNTPPTVEQVANRNYEYKLVLESDIQQLGKVLFLFLDRYNRFTESEFSFTGTAEEFLNLFIKNLERIYPNYGYKIGFVVNNGIRTIDFQSKNCLEVLIELAAQFQTEWIVEGNKISLYRKASNSGISLSYGKGNGLYSLRTAPQSNSNPITRIYAYGGSKNLGSNYRLGAKRLRMAHGLYVEKNVNIYGVIEAVKIFDDIYPRRTCIVTAVTSPFVFTVAAMDFDINAQLMPGITAKLKFNTGQLGGYLFEIDSYNNGTKTFTIKKNTDEQTLDIPSALLTPAIGDEFFLQDIFMPLIDITNAEAELAQMALKSLDEVAGNVPIIVSGLCDPINFKNTGKTVTIGQLITIGDPNRGFAKTTRVIKFSRNLRKPSLFTMDWADEVKENVIVKLINA